MFIPTLHKTFVVIGLLVLSLFIASCATMSEEECLAADWLVVGEADGAAGYSPQSRFAEYVSDCSKIGVTPDQTLWNQGYQKGLTRFCTPMNGLNRGQRGAGYTNICSSTTAAGFYRGYELGKRAYDLRRQIKAAESSIATKQTTISQTFQTIGEMDEVGRLRAEYEIADLNRQINAEQRKIGRLSGDLALVERDISNFRYRMSSI